MGARTALKEFDDMATKLEGAHLLATSTAYQAWAYKHRFAIVEALKSEVTRSKK